MRSLSPSVQLRCICTAAAASRFEGRASKSPMGALALQWLASREHDDALAIMT